MHCSAEVTESSTNKQHHLSSTQGASVFPGSSRLGIEPKTPGWLVQDPTTRPIGDLIPTIGDLEPTHGGAEPGQCIQYSVMVIRGNGVTLRTQKVIQGDDNVSIK